MTTIQLGANAKALGENTTMATWAGAIARALRVYGVNDHDLFQRAGIDYSLVNHPAQRIPVADMTRLWEMAVTESGDPAFGLAVAEKVNMTTFHTLGVAAMASETVWQAGEMVTRFASMVSDGIDMRLHQDGQEVGLILGMRPGYPRFADACVEAVLGAILLTAWQLMPDAQPSRVTFQHRCAADLTAYEKFFRCPVRFASDSDGLYGETSGLSSSTFPTSSPQVAQASAAICEEYLVSRQQGEMGGKVKQLLARSLHQGAVMPLQEVARDLAMSERKLQRLLRDEGVQFRDLLDEVRAHAARQLLGDNSLSVGRVAEQLGFDSLSAFSRAFRRWYGTTPRALRGAAKDGSTD